MRSLTLSLLTAGLMLALPAMAQDPWANTDPNCAPEFHDRAREAAEAAQEKSLADAQATDDFNVKIKDAPEDDSGKLLSCVDEVWPELGAHDSFFAIEYFLDYYADKTVEKFCKERRDEFREKRSNFANKDFLVDRLRTVVRPDNGNQPSPGTQPPPGSQQPNPGGGNQPPSPILPPPGNQQPNPGGGIGDLIRPNPTPQPPKPQPQPPGAPGSGIR